MDFQIERARSYFEAASALERHIKPDCRATSQGITALYRGLLERIAEDPYRVLYERVRLSWAEKLRIASRAWWDHRSPIRGPSLLSE
jgi:phytoene synthase